MKQFFPEETFDSAVARVPERTATAEAKAFCFFLQKEGFFSFL